MFIKQSNDLKSQVYQDALALRQAVFVNEQHVPAALEIDADEARAHYLVGYQRQQPVATLRLLATDDYYHVQRVAVAKSARRQGLGQQLMQAAADFTQQSGKRGLILNAQVSAIAFYTRLGYVATDKPRFFEAGIQHQEMIKPFKPDVNSL